MQSADTKNPSGFETVRFYAYGEGAATLSEYRQIRDSGPLQGFAGVECNGSYRACVTKWGPSGSIPLIGPVSDRNSLQKLSENR